MLDPTEGVGDGSALGGKRALITGAASGIGLATARLFLARGASVAAVDRSAVSLAEVIRPLEDRCRQYVADIADSEAVERAVDSTVKSLGGLDVVVNCAGVSSADHPARLGETSDETWQSALGTNLTGTFLVTRAALPHLVRGGGGVIVNIASTYALVAGPRFAAYSASKAGIVELTRTTAVEYAREGVRANAIAPGFVDTPMLRADLGREADPEGARSSILERIPQQKLMSAEQVARVIAFLASDESEIITGALIVADGGFTAI